jgi:hypothetical protein
MAVTKASAQKMTASQVTKKPLNDLMDAIKDASTKGQKKTDFKNLLAEPIAFKPPESTPIKTAQKQEPRTTSRDEITPTPRRTESTPEKTESGDVKNQNTLTTKPIVETGIDLDECTSEIEQGFEQNPLMSITTQPAAPQSQDLKLEAPRLAHTNETDIQEWMKKGRVQIEMIDQTSIKTSDAEINQNLTPEQAQHSLSSIQSTHNTKQRELTQPETLPLHPKFNVDYGETGLSIETTLSTTPSHTPETPQTNQQIQTPVVQPIMSPAELQPLQKGTPQQTGSDLKVSATTTSSIKGAKPATLSTLDKLNALNQIKDQLKQSLQKGETHLKIQLKPHEMGKVDIKLDISRDGLVSALFKAENRETLETLTRHAVDFQNIFKDAGLQADSQGMNFSMSREDHPDQKTFDGIVYTDDLPTLEEVKATSSGLLPSSQINILT